MKVMRDYVREADYDARRVSVKRNPPKGFIPCRAVKITRNKGRLEVRIKK